MEAQSHNQLADLTLILAISRKQKPALTSLYSRYAPVLYGLICRLIPQPLLAEQVLQEVFLKVWNNPQGYQPKQFSLLTWLLRLARETALEVRSAEIITASELMESTQMETIAGKALELVYLRGLDCAEAASALAVTKNTLTDHLRSALHQLKSQPVS